METLYILALPVAFAVLRGLRGLAKHYSAGDLVFSWKRLAGSVGLFAFIAALSTLGLSIGMDTSDISAMAVEVVTSTGLGWGFTDVIEDVLKKKTA